MKKKLKEHEGVIDKYEDKIRVLKMEIQNNKLVDDIYDGDDVGMGLGNELGDLEYVSPSPRHQKGSARKQ